MYINEEKLFMSKINKIELNDEDLNKVTGGGNYGTLDDSSSSEEFVDRGLMEAGKLYYKKYLDGKITKERYHSLLENLVAIRPSLINNVNNKVQDLIENIEKDIERSLQEEINRNNELFK